MSKTGLRERIGQREKNKRMKKTKKRREKIQTCSSYLSKTPCIIRERDQWDKGGFVVVKSQIVTLLTG